MKKDSETHRQIVTADISAESLTGMVIFRPHYLGRVGGGAVGTTRIGDWYALRPAEARSFARALSDAADAMDLKSRALQAAQATGTAR